MQTAKENEKHQHHISVQHISFHCLLAIAHTIQQLIPYISLSHNSYVFHFLKHLFVFGVKLFNSLTFAQFHLPTTHFVFLTQKCLRHFLTQFLFFYFGSLRAEYLHFKSLAKRNCFSVLFSFFKIENIKKKNRISHIVCSGKY